VILCGKLKLYHSDLTKKKLCKVCNPGETVGEELLFIRSAKKIVYESAKTMSKCFMIQINTDNYKKMSEEMIKFGYKMAFYEMESIIRRNFITKNWLRNDKIKKEDKN
jgi:hypothetical protein